MRGRRFDLDWTLLLAALALVGIGISALASAVGPQAGFAWRQAEWLGFGLAAMVIFLAIGYRTWGEAAPWLYGLNLLLLGMVLAMGHRVNGSKSWIDLGPINIQPSEFMKVCTVLVMAKVLASYRGTHANLPIMAALAAVVGLPLALVLLQPDMGTALTFVAVLGVVLLAVGLGRRTWVVLVVSGVVAGAAGWSYVLKDYQKARIRTFLYPETDAQSTGYQIIQSRIAIGSGGLLGKGYASGTQSQLNFIPEKHTDFIFPVVAEEWGFLGTLVVLGLYAVVVGRGLRIAAEARDAFGSYLVLGVVALISAHVLVNLGMVTGLLPTIGIPLPLMSYGGSSLVSTMAAIGLILNVRLRRTANG